MGRCHGEVARPVLAKVRGDVFARFHAVAAKRRSITRNSQFGLLDKCFVIPKLLYRWRHQSGIFWIPPRIVIKALLRVGSKWRVTVDLSLKRVRAKAIVPMLEANRSSACQYCNRPCIIVYVKLAWQSYSTVHLSHRLGQLKPDTHLFSKLPPLFPDLASGFC
jgi:hypothetical protein